MKIFLGVAINCTQIICFSHAYFSHHGYFVLNLLQENRSEKEESNRMSELTDEPNNARTRGLCSSDWKLETRIECDKESKKKTK